MSPGIPSVTVELYDLGPNGVADAKGAPDFDDVLISEVQTDDWQQPQDCDVRDGTGALYPAPAFVSDGCLEVPLIANETKDGRFDGGYAIESYCPPVNGESNIGENGCRTDEDPLPPGDYVVQVEPPPHYQIIKEEDQNTDQGDEIVPQVPPPPCVGDLHLVDDPRNPADGDETPLCDQKLVTVEAQQNAAADFFLFTGNGVPIPGRIYGLVSNDLLFETDPDNIWFGEARAVPDTPIGVYDFEGKLIKTITTDENGFYEILLPSTYTALCPTPSGVCPGMYELIINDPGTSAAPNRNFKADFLTAVLAFDVWPGKTTYADTPLDPISTFSCNDYRGPQVFSVSRVHMPTARAPPAAGSRSAASTSVAGGGAPTGDLEGLPDRRRELDRHDDQRPRPGRSPGGLPFAAPGPRQLRVTAPNGVTSVNGLTFHITGPVGYSPTIRTVNGPPGSPNPAPSIQAAINASSRTANTLIDVFPGV